MAIKPEDILREIAAARGDAICVPTMTTSPAWRTLAPDDLHFIPEYYRLSRERRGPAAVLVGLETA